MFAPATSDTLNFEILDFRRLYTSEFRKYFFMKYWWKQYFFHSHFISRIIFYIDNLIRSEYLICWPLSVDAKIISPEPIGEGNMCFSIYTRRSTYQIFTENEVINIFIILNAGRQQPLLLQSSTVNKNPTWLPYSPLPHSEVDK